MNSSILGSLWNDMKKAYTSEEADKTIWSELLSWPKGLAVNMTLTIIDPDSGFEALSLQLLLDLFFMDGIDAELRMMSYRRIRPQIGEANLEL